MDDLFVLDLLVCPVCLGKLDVTAKVLPCQHTFCQPCLQRLFKARKELRCPECRTPVFCSIEELPTNLLLVRLLDGIRGGQSVMRKNSLRRVGGLFGQESFKRNREHKEKNDSYYRLFPKARMPIEGVPCAKALTNYKGYAPSDLTFNKGDIIVLRRQLDEKWFYGELNGSNGIFPASSVKILCQLQEPPALCRALYNFELKDKDRGENKACLKFVKDDIISVIRRVDENWAEGKLGDQVGIFPLLFVEPNHAAKQLLETNKSKIKRNSLSSSSFTLKRLPSNAKSSESATLSRMPEGRRKSPRQFLITNALNTFNKMVHSPGSRQTPEISTPILISSSNPTVIEKADILPGSQIQVNGAVYYTTLGTQGQGSALVSLPNSQQSVVANMCVALQPYIAHGPEEIDLQKGEGIRVLGKFQEGWLRGVSLVTGKIGVFPSHCVIPVYRKSLNYSEFRPSSHHGNWVSSSASVSSQGSVTDYGPVRTVRSVFVPTAVVEPVKKNTSSSAVMAPVAQRRAGSSIKKRLSLQNSVQSSPFAISTITRPSSAIVQTQQLLISSHSNVGASPETSRPTHSYDSFSLVGRGTDFRRLSAASYVALEAKEILFKSEQPVKPPTSAPPSILVKPDTPKSSSDKQVKTVRFMNFSPPPLKRHSAQFPQDNGKSEQISTESPKPEPTPTPETTISTVQRASSSFVQQTENRRVQRLKSSTNDHPSLSLPSKRTLNDNSKRWSAVYQTQDVLST
ncbi:E3 ubiquitin-protein ligase SH3RF2 [Bombina bombina]|uniref:E3 ubiquitin-protein ligase SH3RF2 n=1 Tax=Bombina bombina TaxID=8345 RepID=UPI00235B23E2|nr:E3 ubiquitin-protein ligase SH3RF2 [Bombina bombina]